MPDRSCDAVLLDIDGTLVDTNYLHIDAWSRALEEVGRPAAAWRIHRAIGMDSGRLLQDLLGDDVDRLGDDAKARHGEHYGRDRDRMRAFDGAQDLLRTLAERGFQVVLATSAPQEEFDALMDVLQPGDTVATVTTAQDVETAKPEPDVVRVALERAGVDADRAVMVGDSVWDVESAKRAGVRCIGVRSGGVSAAELRQTGAVEVYDDAGELLRHLDDGPLYER
ncbi:HAD family hydrolase [Amnibacterium endophyticum]|uniref:HAD family hydrolase n=1 Tax=Amnibacterium endophyticum TaxID=2109337 RepID=A0ABW4LHW9_9MICO